MESGGQRSGGLVVSPNEERLDGRSPVDRDAAALGLVERAALFRIIRRLRGILSASPDASGT